MSCFSVRCIVFLLYERLKNFIPSWRGVVQSGPSSHRAAGLWLATALPLTAERAVSAMGFEQEGMSGLGPGEEVRPTAHRWLVDLRVFFSDICAWATEPDSPFKRLHG